MGGGGGIVLAEKGERIASAVRGESPGAVPQILAGIMPTPEARI